MNATEFTTPANDEEVIEMTEQFLRYIAMLRDAKERVEVLQTIIDTLNNRLDEYYARIKEND